MNRILARFCAPALLALVLGSVAHAKPSNSPPLKPVNEAARLEADKLISTVGGRDLFLNETREGAILIRHKASNFQCLFNPGSPNALLVTTGTPRRGDEVGCDGPTMHFQTTYFIDRAGPTDTLDSQFKEAVGEVRARWPQAMTIKVAGEPGQDVLAKLAATAPPNKTSWFLARTDQGWAFTRVSVAKAGEWLITMRAAGPVEAHHSAESLTEMLWLTRLMVMIDPSLATKPLVAQAGHKKR